MTENKETGLDNIILVGKKGVRTYSEAVDVQFNVKKNKLVILKTRGQSISKAVSIAEFVNRKNEDITIGDIKIGSEKFKVKDDDGTEKEIYVSSIEIQLIKG